VTSADGSGWRPGTGQAATPAPAVAPAAADLRVVMDLRPLQDPERAPLTATYLEALLDALDAQPRPGESFSFLLAADLDDPTGRWTHLEVVGNRRLPPTRLLRSGALTVDPFVLRGAAMGAGWRAGREAAAGTVYHGAAGGLPIASGIPVVASLLDLAPWAMPDAYQAGTVARFGQRLRSRLIKDARAVLVPSRATAAEARRLLRVRAARIRLIPLAARSAYRPQAAAGARLERERLGLGERYVVYAGRYDARQDLPTLFAALSALAEEPPPAGLPDALWPPRVCLVGATPGDRAAMSRAAVRAGVADAIAYAPRLADDRLAALVAGARFLVQPVRSEASGLAALDALAAGVPVVASAIGALPEVVGPAGVLVEPGDPARLATAIRAVWSDDVLHATLVAAAGERADGARTWADVARETRAVWSEVARPAPML
jgi:glycosyltransferase involved in cell wall biosynthesis